jgi:putative transposase
MMKIPIRRQLPHEVPLWVDPTKAHYFITVTCKRRGKNQLANPIVASRIFETVNHRNAHQTWYAHLVLIMPDHVHLLLSFPDPEKRMQTIVSKWKEWTAKTLKIEWQRDFFEHRVRKEESFREKADYILANPIRAGLVKVSEDWPYVFIAKPW